MKTGRLLKFSRGGASIHAYLYREGGAFTASLYVLEPATASHEPTHTLRGDSESGLERDVRAWVEAQYPRKTP
jgi:hypothetical protein